MATAGFDHDVEDLLTWSYRLAVGVQLSWVLVLTAIPLYVLWNVGTAAGVGLWGLLYLIGSVPVLRVRAETELVTVKSPSAVRAEFVETTSPAIALMTAGADEVWEPSADNDSDAIAVVRNSTLGIFTREFEIEVVEGNDGALQIKTRLGEDTFSTIEVRIDPHGGGSRVFVTADTDRRRPRHLVSALLQAPIERRLFEAHGYREVRTTVDVDVRLRGNQTVLE